MKRVRKATDKIVEKLHHEYQQADARHKDVVSVTTKYHHNFTAFVERFNKTLAERLFKAQDA